jgi:N-acetylmuramoyl-L-alanine amidase
MRRDTDDNTSPIRGHALVLLSRIFLIGSIIASLAFVVSFALYFPSPSQLLALVPSPPTRTPAPTRTPTITPTPVPPPIALVAGHSGGIDPGAFCPDGLREVDVTTDVARRTKTILEARGYRADILAEFDSRLDATRRDYAPSVFLAIHADSCVYYATGYKVARAENSAIPQEDDRLVRCVSSAYAAATQLAFHEGSITRDMTHYHALDEISAQSPAAIIELGFLGSDHDILKNRRDLLAQGLSQGIDSFLRGNACSQ